MSGAAFEEVYRDRLWRVSASDYQGQVRVAIWSHFKDRDTGEWKPCRGKGDPPGFFIPAERLPELEATIVEIGKQLRSGAL